MTCEAKLAGLRPVGSKLFFGKKDGQYVAVTHNLKEPTLFDPPSGAIQTLTGLLEYLNRISEIPATGNFLHVVDYRTVDLVTAPQGWKRERDVFVEAQCDECAFKFNTYLGQAEFMIGLQANFVQSGDAADLLKKVGTIRENKVRVSQDDGVTQNVTASAGVALAQDVSLPPRILLAPYRTFRELEQPQSMFVLRARTGQTNVELALFDAD